MRGADCATTDERTCAARTCNNRTSAARVGNARPPHPSSTIQRKFAPALRERNLMLLYYGAMDSVGGVLDAATVGV